MIKRVEIHNVGRFKSFKQQAGEESFKKNTFIYGNNTFGKSTLTAIFRSLRENKPDYIIGRKTIGAEKQLAKIIPETTTSVGEYRFTSDDGVWNAKYKDVIIFDSHFVRESVYTQSQQIGQEQQKNIESFMLGTKGTEYGVRIAMLTEQISENTKTQTSISTEYSRNKHLFGNFAFDIFLGLTEIEGADGKLDKLKKGFDEVKNSELISSKLNALKSLLKEYRDFDTETVSERLSINSDLIATHYEAHINKNENRQKYSNFLQSGSVLRLRSDDELCPFCTQKITDSARTFLETIDSIYTDKYRNLQRHLKEAEVLFGLERFSKELQEIVTDLQQAGYVLEIDFSDISDLLAFCLKAIEVKKEDLVLEFNNLPFVDLSTKIIDRLAVLERELINFKNPLERKAELDVAYKELLANRERFSAWKERCENYLKAKQENERLSPEKSKVWDEYLGYANGLSETMLGDINDVLRTSNCNFTVQTFKFKGNQRQDLLVLNMGGKEILNDGDDNEMTIKNSLSDSDKWVLALAFFLATVKNDSTIEVVVMDDPVSSFDADRKRIILKEIKRILSGTGKQLILLTHEKGFYHLLHSESNDPDSAFLRIAFDETSGSKLIVCNPNEDFDFMSEFNCWVTDMRNATSSHDLLYVKNAHANIRLVMEHILKAKYSLELTKEQKILSQMLTTLEQSGGSYETKSPRKSIESILTNLLHHDNSGAAQYPSCQLGIDDYKSDIREAFEVIKRL